jgi:tRNA-specific 2-thiouridylase
MTAGVFCCTLTSMVLAIALSGGVDSAVAAALLKKKVPRMVGASHVIWPGSRCCSEEVLDRAGETCRILGIPYIQEDLSEEFRDLVVEDFVQSYLNGKTPNPCVICNKRIRFDAFYLRLTSTLMDRGLLEAQEKLLFATGHYARIVQNREGLFIAKGVDSAKDQSYVLCQVDRQMLGNLVLPLGEYRKSEVIALANDFALPYTQVRESQDACFVEDNYVEFIEKQTGRRDLLREGEIVDPQGRVLGRHRGAINYTVGQRRGLALGNGPWYVARIDARANRLVVAREAEARRRIFVIERTNWFIDPPKHPLSCAVKIRYQIDETRCIVEPEDRGFRVSLEDPRIVSPGQSAVFYDGDLVLGGGIIL